MELFGARPLREPGIAGFCADGNCGTAPSVTQFSKLRVRGGGKGSYRKLQTNPRQSRFPGFNPRNGRKAAAPAEIGISMTAWVIPVCNA